MQIDDSKLEILGAQRLQTLQTPQSQRLQSQRPQVRTQARVRYSKAPPRYRARSGASGGPKRTVGGSRGAAAGAAGAEKTWRERMVLQAIICGGFLAALLIFSIVDTAFTNGVTSWVERNLSFDFFAYDDGVGSWTDRVLNIFETTETAPIDYADIDNSPHSIPEGSLTPGDSWIDESILEEIGN